MYVGGDRLANGMLVPGGMPRISLRCPPVRSLARLCRLNHHGWREKPDRLSAPRPAKRFSAASRSSGGRRSTRLGTVFLVLHAPRRTLGKRPCEAAYFSNSSRAARTAVFKRGKPARPSLHRLGSFRRDYSTPQRPRRSAVNRESIFTANRAAVIARVRTSVQMSMPIDRRRRRRRFRSRLAVCCFLRP